MSATLGHRMLVPALLAVGALVAVGACSEDAQRRTSSRGEACQVTADCSDGLACRPNANSAGGVCVTAEFHVQPTAKDCVIVECETASDCCDPSPNGCANSIACMLGKCVSSCLVDNDCSTRAQGHRCGGGKCVQCAIDQDCPDGTQCNDGACQPKCSGDGDCSGFDRCVASRCVSSGCQLDRECVAASRNVTARCGTDGKCIVPCETDLECGDPTSYAFYSCIDSECTYVGCESDKDCRLFYFGASDASTLGAQQHIVCQDRGIGTAVTKPAH